jgi:hypothetical protein
LHKYEPKIEKEIFIQLTEAFRVNKLKGWHGTMML